MAPGRSAADLADYLHQLKGKNRVRVVCMDLSETFRSIARKSFPNALVVADRFHVVRLALHHLMKTCGQIDPQLRWSRGMTVCLRKHAKNLTEKQEKKLADYLENSPAIRVIYDFKEELMTLLNQKDQTKDQCRLLTHDLLENITLLKDSEFDNCQTLGKTLESWQAEIGRQVVLCGVFPDRMASQKASTAR